MTPPSARLRPRDKRPPTLRALAEKLAAEPGGLATPAADLGLQALVSEIRAHFDEEPPIDLSSFSAGPRARTILRGKEIAAADLRESGGAYTLEEVRILLNGVSRQSVEKRVREGKLLAVLGPNNKRYYPVAQFNDDGSVVEGLPAVRQALRTENGYAVLNFLVNPSPQLDHLKPVDLLKKGEVEIVVEAAERSGEQGG